MKTYGLRTNRPKAGHQYVRRLCYGQRRNDVSISSEERYSHNSQWLRQITPHIQQFILQATSNEAKGEKHIRKMSLSKH